MGCSVRILTGHSSTPWGDYSSGRRGSEPASTAAAVLGRWSTVDHSTSWETGPRGDGTGRTVRCCSLEGTSTPRPAHFDHALFRSHSTPTLSRPYYDITIWVAALSRSVLSIATLEKPTEHRNDTMESPILKRPFLQIRSRLEPTSPSHKCESTDILQRLVLNRLSH